MRTPRTGSACHLARPPQRVPGSSGFPRPDRARGCRPALVVQAALERVGKGFGKLAGGAWGGLDAGDADVLSVDTLLMSLPSLAPDVGGPRYREAIGEGSDVKVAGGNCV